MINANSRLQSNIETYYEQQDTESSAEELEYIREQINDLERDDTRAILMALGMFGFAMFIMFSNHAYLSSRQRESDEIVNKDPLTGVKSKHAFLTMAHETDGRISVGKENDFAVVVCDVNGLKHVNDTQGHAAGDELIKGAANCLTFAVGNKGKIYRIGGDEFVIIMFTEEPEVIRSEIKEKASQWRGVYTDELTLSVGYATNKDRIELTVDEIEHMADKDMYNEKEKYYQERGIDKTFKMKR